MKKNALTLVELFVAMTMLLLLVLVAMSSIKFDFFKINKEKVALKFRPAYASISEAVYRLRNSERYFGYDFSYTLPWIDPDNHKVYEGREKFRKLFKSQFNVLENKIKFADNDIGSVPAYSYTYKETVGSEEKEFTDFKKVDFNDLECFSENKGLIYCLPITPTKEDLEKLGKKDCKLKDIYLRLYLDKVDFDKEATFNNNSAVYLTISAKGKVDLPNSVKLGDKVIVSNAIDESVHALVWNKATKANVDLKYHSVKRDE